MFEGPIILQAEDEQLLAEMDRVEIRNADIEMAVGCIRTSIRQAAKILCNPPVPVVRKNLERQFQSMLESIVITEEEYDAALADKRSATALLLPTAKFQDALDVARGKKPFIEWKRPRTPRTINYFANGQMHSKEV